MHLPTFVSSLVLVLLLGCNKPDLSTPKASAEALIRAMNAGDEKAFLKLLDPNGLDVAKAHCEEFKKKPEPQKPTSDPYGFGELFYSVSMDRRSQDCSQIGEELRNRLSALSAEKTISLHSIDVPEIKDGRSSVVIHLEPPDWNGDKKYVDDVLLVQDVEKKWRPVSGAMEIPVANLRFSMPIFSTWWAGKKLEKSLH